MLGRTVTASRASNGDTFFVDSDDGSCCGFAARLAMQLFARVVDGTESKQSKRSLQIYGQVAFAANHSRELIRLLVYQQICIVSNSSSKASINEATSSINELSRN